MKPLIFVLDRGFVVVGLAELSNEYPLHWHMLPGRTIRIWGTTEGLAQLKDGPTDKTVLDAAAERYTPFRSVIDIIVPTEAGAERWKKLLSI